MFFVYIIYSEEKDIYYKGFTTNIENRIIQHNSNEGKFTSSKGAWKLVYQKSFETKREALMEEKRIKKLNRVSIEKLILKG